jgi:hypothetical protein
MKISRAKATSLIKGSQGKVIGVTFIKKNGETRMLNGRTGVYKSKKTPLKGGSLGYLPSDFGLVSIFDMQLQAYRMVNINTLSELKVSGETYEVED